MNVEQGSAATKEGTAIAKLKDTIRQVTRCVFGWSVGANRADLSCSAVYNRTILCASNENRRNTWSPR